MIRFGSGRGAGPAVRVLGGAPATDLRAADAAGHAPTGGCHHAHRHRPARQLGPPGEPFTELLLL